MEQGNEKTEEGDEKLDTAACFMHNVISLLNCPYNFRRTERSSHRKKKKQANEQRSEEFVDKKLTVSKQRPSPLPSQTSRASAGIWTPR